MTVPHRLFLIGVIGLLFLRPACAQSDNVTTVEGGRGQKTTLTEQPRALAAGLSVRAMGISEPDTTRWALSLIGAGPNDDIALRYGSESLPLLDVQRPDDGVGPTRVYVSQQTFLTMAESSAVTLQIGTTSVSLPASLRREMQQIFGQVTE